jgi:hypothetical protein
LPPNFKNCLGFDARDNGQRRVPGPPHNMIGIIGICAVEFWLLIAR